MNTRERFSTSSDTEENSVEMQDMATDENQSTQQEETSTYPSELPSSPEHEMPDAEATSSPSPSTRVDINTLPPDLRSFIQNLQNHVTSHLGSPSDIHDLHPTEDMQVEPSSDLPPLLHDSDEEEIFGSGSEQANQQEESSTQPAPSTNTANPPTPNANHPHVLRFVILYEPVNPPSNNEGASTSESETTDAPQPSPQPSHPMRLVLSFLLNFNGPMGSEGGNFEDVMDHLFRQYVPEGPPPASKDIVQQLPKKILEDPAQLIGKERCTICCEDYQLGEHFMEMPCHHDFHVDCLNPWLKDRNTCPVCRYELPTESASEEDEKSRQQRMADRRISEQDFFTVHEGTS